VASAVSEALSSQNMSSAAGDGSPNREFLVSDLTENFVKSAQRFFGEEIQLRPGGPWFNG